MASPVSSEVFWAALERSGLLTEQQLAVMQDSLLSQDAPVAELSRQLVQSGWLTPFQADRLLQGRSRGFFFDHYKIVDLLGLGGMGWVYHAVDTVTNEPVALKVLRDDLKLDAGMLARFQQEARVGLQLDHPNIVRTKSIGSAGGMPYVIMELVPGPNLLEILTLKRRLPWPQACEFARQAALGLDYAHQRGVVHRDVKPQNLLLNQAGEVRLLDFGLSMFQDGESGDEFSLAMIFGHESVGTSEFAAPEQVQDSLAADARSDVFSLGATLFASLTGLNPFPVGNKKADYQVCSRSVREFVPSIPVEVAEIVTRMLEADPQRRFRTAGEVAAALSSWSKPGPVEFDFAAIMRERKDFARQRLAQISESAASALGFARSTARPAEVSSVAQSSAPRTTILATGDLSLSPQLTGVKGSLPESIRGPAVRWAADPKPRSSQGAALVVLSGEGRIPLLQDRVLVGRGDECELRLTDPAISSRHGEFQFDGRRWWIRDLASRNGTTVNGAAVKRHALRAGDEIAFAAVQRFRWDCERSGGNTAKPNLRFALSLIAGFLMLLLAAWLIVFVLNR